MIIYAETKQRFLEDIDRNRLERKLVDGFARQTGGVPADRDVWADEYARFSGALRRAAVDADVQVAIEYHISAAGRSRVDVLLAGSDGTRDHGLVLELKAWSDAEASPVPEMVVGPYGGGSLTQHPRVQARKYQGLILRFNADIAEKGIGIHSAAYLFNLVRRRPERWKIPATATSSTTRISSSPTMPMPSRASSSDTSVIGHRRTCSISWRKAGSSRRPRSSNAWAACSTATTTSS
jgi:hypothetical protein